MNPADQPASRPKPIAIKTKRRESILWIEGLGFSLIVALTWLTEVLHVPYFLFSESAAFNWPRVLWRTAVIVSVWAAVHLSTRRLLQRLHHLEEYLLVCSWCRKIGHEGAWKTMENYFGTALDTQTTHGICPECRARMELAPDQKPRL
jgi:hypothetical protein